MTFHAKSVVIIAQENIMEFMRAMDVLAFLNVLFAVIVNMYASLNLMGSVWLTRLTEISVVHAD